MQDTNENRLVHLGMIQTVIGRMAGTSFILKGWSVTIVAGLSALAAADARESFAYVALFPALLFWGLDAYYLRQERRFRALYNSVRRAKDGSLGERIFSMDTEDDGDRVKSLALTTLAPTLAAFHGTIFAVVVIVVLASL